MPRQNIIINSFVRARSERERVILYLLAFLMEEEEEMNEKERERGGMSGRLTESNRERGEREREESMNERTSPNGLLLPNDPERRIMAALEKL